MRLYRLLKEHFIWYLSFWVGICMAKYFSRSDFASPLYGRQLHATPRTAPASSHILLYFCANTSLPHACHHLSLTPFSLCIACFELFWGHDFLSLRITHFFLALPSHTSLIFNISLPRFLMLQGMSRFPRESRHAAWIFWYWGKSLIKFIFVIRIASPSRRFILCLFRPLYHMPSLLLFSPTCFTFSHTLASHISHHWPHYRKFSFNFEEESITFLIYMIDYRYT